MTEKKDQKSEKKIRELQNTNHKLTVAVIILGAALALSTAVAITTPILMTKSHQAEIKHMDELEKSRLSELNEKNLALLDENNQLKKTNKTLVTENEALKKHAEQLQTLNEQQKEMFQSENTMQLESIEEYVVAASRRMAVPIEVPEGAGLSRISVQVKSGNKLDFYLMTDEENAQKFANYNVIKMISSASKTYSYEVTDLLPPGTYYLGAADSSWGILSESKTTFTVSLYCNHDNSLTPEDYSGKCDY